MKREAFKHFARIPYELNQTQSEAELHYILDEIARRHTNEKYFMAGRDELEILLKWINVIFECYVKIKFIIFECYMLMKIKYG